MREPLGICVCVCVCGCLCKSIPNKKKKKTDTVACSSPLCRSGARNPLPPSPWTLGLGKEINYSMSNLIKNRKVEFESFSAQLQPPRAAKKETEEYKTRSTNKQGVKNRKRHRPTFVWLLDK